VFVPLQEYAASGGDLVQYGTSSERAALDVADLIDGSLWFEADTGKLYQWQAKTLTWVWVLGTATDTYTLTTSTTQIPAPAGGHPGAELVVMLMQDSTGGRAITWGAGFAYTSVSLGNALANTVSVFRFVFLAGLWVMVGQPTTDMVQ
jgi:hypothetical protein